MKTIREIAETECATRYNVSERKLAIDFAESVLAAYLAQQEPLPPIERDEEMDRTYIPVHPNWEIQTKGRGSSFRIAKRNYSRDERWLVCDSHLHAMLEEMARDIHANLAPPVPAGMQLVPVEPTIATQDECCTRDPIYVVYGKREIVVDGDYDHDRTVWVNTESGDYREATEAQSKRLDKLHSGGRDTKGFTKLAVKEIDEFQTACFTRVGAEVYLSINGHNISKPFIYVHSLYRNAEMLGIREAMLNAVKEM